MLLRRFVWNWKNLKINKQQLLGVLKNLQETEGWKSLGVFQKYISNKSQSTAKRINRIRNLSGFCDILMKAANTNKQGAGKAAKNKKKREVQQLESRPEAQEPQTKKQKYLFWFQENGSTMLRV